MSDSPVQYGPYKGRVAERFLADVDHFLSTDRRWGEIALLKAAKTDHRFLSRIRKGESFRIDSIDAVADAMTRAARGELDPEEFRNIRGAEQQRGGSASRQEQNDA